MRAVTSPSTFEWFDQILADAGLGARFPVGKHDMLRAASSADVHDLDNLAVPALDRSGVATTPERRKSISQASSEAIAAFE